MEIAVRSGLSLGPFALGESLYASVKILQTSLPSHRATVLCSQLAPSSSAVYVLCSGPHDDLFIVRFNPALQTVESIDYAPPPGSGARLCLRQDEKTFTLLPRASVQSVTQVLGEPNRYLIHQPNKEQKLVTLVYSGICLVFECDCQQEVAMLGVHSLQELSSRLVRLYISHVLPAIPLPREAMAPQLAVGPAHLPQVRFIVHAPHSQVTGLEVQWTSTGTGTGSSARSVRVMFGDGSEDLLSSLGHPDEVYYKDDDHWSHTGMSRVRAPTSTFLRQLSPEVSYSYQHLGIDVLFSTTTNQVAKIIVHCNAPNHAEFCSYARCHFKLSLAEGGRGFAINASTCTEPEKANLLLTPDTNWNMVKSHVDGGYLKKLATCRHSPSTNTCYPFPDTELWALWDQLIVEVVEREGSIATLTILPPGESALLQSRCQYTPAHSEEPLSITQMETPIEARLKLPSIPTSSLASEEFCDCKEDPFYSAESSLASSVMEPTTIGVSSSPERVKKETGTAYLSRNVNISTMNPTAATEIERPSDQPAHEVSMHQSTVIEFKDSGLCGVDDGSFPCSTDVLYESERIRVSRMLTETDGTSTTVSLRDDGSSAEASPEYGSFDIISYKETTKSHQVAPSPALLPGEEGEKEEVGERGEESTMDATNMLTSPILSVGAVDHSASKAQQDHKEEDTEPHFHYQPQSTALTGSRVLTITDDADLFTRPLDELHAPPKLRPGGKGKPTHSSSTSGSSRRGKQGRDSAVVISRRAGANMSVREEAKKRLHSHTKSSQQKTRTKYTQPESTMETEANLAEVQDDNGLPVEVPESSCGTYEATHYCNGNTVELHNGNSQEVKPDPVGEVATPTSNVIATLHHNLESNSPTALPRTGEVRTATTEAILPTDLQDSSMAGPAVVSKPGSTACTAQDRAPPKECYEGETSEDMVVTTKWKVEGEEGKEQVDRELDRVEGEEGKERVERELDRVEGEEETREVEEGDREDEVEVTPVIDVSSPLKSTCPGL